MATNITLADLTACDDGAVLVTKGAVGGSRRHISQVANGLRCGCVCYGCGRALVAKNGGDQNRHHFAHQPDEVTANCATAGETALHILSKEIIARHRRVSLPATSVLGIDGKPVEVTPERSIDLTDVRLEVVALEVVPDVTATMASTWSTSTMCLQTDVLGSWNDQNVSPLTTQSKRAGSSASNRIAAACCREYAVVATKTSAGSLIGRMFTSASSPPPKGGTKYPNPAFGTVSAPRRSTAPSSRVSMVLLKFRRRS
ncbi:hypothetical protein J3A65_001236 [Rhizobium sp. PvP014]|nr:hypothetical protein [Rhizobium sp. PvP014]MBP2527869.1 hypothetical protein [Rhizobium sp. PvP099]